jgi:hypothetical protein
MPDFGTNFATAGGQSVAGPLDVAGPVSAPAVVADEATIGELTVETLLVDTVNGMQIWVGSADPTAGGGVVGAVRPAIYLRTGTNQIWLQTGAAATAWTQLALTASPTFTGTIQAAAANLSGALGLSGALTLNSSLGATFTRPASITANQLNSSDFGSTLFTVLTSNAAYDLDGLGGAAGQVRIVVNGNTTAGRNFTFVHNGSGTNKYFCPAAANHVLGPGKAALVAYDPAVSFWLVIPFN